MVYHRRQYPCVLFVSRVSFLCLFRLFVLHSSSSFVQAIQLLLTPSTTPEQIITTQLEALQKESLSDVYALASPTNKQQVGSIENFERMIRNHPYYNALLQHERSTILLESAVGTRTKQYLVRVKVKDNNNNTGDDKSGRAGGALLKDFWWSLSRVSIPSHPQHDCFMVDAVLPATPYKEGYCC